MSLSTWFKDYVYIPLGGNRKFQIRNILVVWALTGLWHGASWNFVLWGAYFGILLIIEKYGVKKYLDKAPDFIKHFYTMFLVVISFYIFAFDDLNNLFEYGKILFGFSSNAIIDNTFVFYLSNYLVILILAIIFSLPVYKIIRERMEKHWIISSIIYIALFVLVVAYLVSNTYNPFLYFRF